MSLEFDLDLTDMTEQEAESGGSVLPDWYLAACSNVEEDPHHPGTILFDFLVIAGPFAGSTIKDRLFESEGGGDPDKAKNARKRWSLFGKRLGALSSADFGSRVRIDWGKAIGRQCILQVAERTYKDKDNVQRTTASIKFDGVYQVDSERVPAEVRKKLLAQRRLAGWEGGAAASGTVPTVAAGAAAARPNYADL